ncbi:MAG: S8 family peptidase [Clostridiales bacterium]|jgi:hypothetical protein|nr:S8 family peptidase [Clostridiales bacterium]
MDNYASQNNFIESPDMVDFPTLDTDPLRTEAGRWPYIHVGKTIDSGIAAVYIPEDRIDQVLSDLGANYRTARPILFGLMGMADMETSGIPLVYEHPTLNLTGKGVIVGFVDTGIDYTLSIFQQEDKTTRIKYIWDQSISGRPPEGFGYGSEYDENTINSALNTSEPHRIVSHEDSVGHGTFLASIAAGSGEGDYNGAAPMAGIIAVKLRKAHRYHLKRTMTPESVENIFSGSDIMMGIEYILEKARRLSMPVAICVGLGSNQSSHAGIIPLDDYLSRVGIRTGVAICVAAGNEALAGHHASGTILSAGEHMDVLIRCNEGKAIKGFYMEIWNQNPDRMSVSVTAPTGERIARVPARQGSTYQGRLSTEPSVIHIEYYTPAFRTGSQLTYIQITDPVPGIWTVTVYGDNVLGGYFHIWLPATGLGDPNVQFMYPDSYCTVTEPGVTQGVITVGAYSATSMNIHPPSSWGPTNLPTLAPDLTAPGEEVTGYFPGGPGAMSGSSVSAAIAAGACALLLEWGILDHHDAAMNTNRIKSYLIRGCHQDGDLRYPNEQWGYGRMDIFNSFIQMV